MRKKTFTLQAVCAVAALGLLALAGCGGSSGSSENSGPSKAGSSPTQKVASGPIKLEDAVGTVTLEKPATKVVALEWSYVEDLLALGVTPAGVSDVKGYGEWVTAGPKLTSSVKDLGLRQEPSLEGIRALNPDLIIAIKTRDMPILDQLKDIAPTLVFDPTRKDMSQFEELRDTFEQIGAATGTSDKAKAVLADLDAKIEAGKTKLVAKAGTQVALSQGYTGESAPEIRMFTSKALAGQLIEKLGLKNAWTGKPDDWGFTTVDVEALTSVSKADFMYVAATKDDIYKGALASNAVWKGLDFVKTGRVYPLDPGTWFFGGPLSAEQIVDEIVKAVA